MNPSSRPARLKGSPSNCPSLLAFQRSVALALQRSVALALQRPAALAQAVVATPLAQAPAQDMAHPQK
jgi:hypothetical protein